MWFWQNGAPSDFADEIIQLLKEKFNGRVVRRNVDANWLPRSCDLIPRDYFLSYLTETGSYLPNFVVR